MAGHHRITLLLLLASACGDDGGGTTSSSASLTNETVTDGALPGYGEYCDYLEGCKDGLHCAWESGDYAFGCLGVCMPTCSNDDDCADLEGAPRMCRKYDGVFTCGWWCYDGNECPSSLAAPLVCDGENCTASDDKPKCNRDDP